MYSDKQKYEDKTYFPYAVKKSQTVAPNDIVSYVVDEYKLLNRIPNNLIKCHNFCIISSVF